MITDVMIGAFIVGVVAGVFIGMLVLGLCIAAARDDYRFKR